MKRFLIMLVIAPLLAIPAPAEAANWTNLYYSHEKGSAKPHIVRIQDIQCDGYPARTQYDVFDSSGAIVARWSVKDHDGCGGNMYINDLRGTGYTVHRIRVQEKRDGKWRSSPWKYVTVLV